MKRSTLALVVSCLLGALPSCNCQPPPGGNTGGGSGTGGNAGSGTGGNAGSGTGGNAGSGTGGGTATGGGTGTGGGGGTSGGGVQPDGGCVPRFCEAQQYQCGDCIDNDGDGKIDDQDPECLGPCHNNESGLRAGIPSENGIKCDLLDCYYDTNNGRGNDSCIWDHNCDPLNPSATQCMYDGNPMPGDAVCPNTQSMQCLNYCQKLTPAGCDCFGCCTAFAPDGGSRDIYLGSELVTPAGTPPCTIATVGNPTICRACTKTMSCGKGACGTCQLCLGKTTLPPECFPDAGVPMLPDGGTTLPDGGVVPLPDGGVPPMRCMPGVQPCGLPGDMPCAAPAFCQTGCCVTIG